MGIKDPIVQGNGIKLSAFIKYLQGAEKKYGDLIVASTDYGSIVHAFVCKREGNFWPPDQTMSQDTNKEGLFLAIW